MGCHRICLSSPWKKSREHERNNERNNGRRNRRNLFRCEKNDLRVESLAFHDDLQLLAEYKGEAQKCFTNLKEFAEKTGLKIFYE